MESSAKREFASWFLLVVSTLLIQISDWKIANFNASLDFKTIEAGNYLQGFTASTIIAEASFMKSLLSFENISDDKRANFINQIVKEFENQLVKDNEIKEAVLKLKSREIGLAEYFGKITNIQKTKAQKWIQKYNITVRDFKKAKQDGTVWTIVKSALLILQFFLLVYLGIGFFKNMRTFLKTGRV